MSRAAIKAYADANFDANGVQGITGTELNTHANAIADEALIKEEVGDLGFGLIWDGGQLAIDPDEWATKLDAASYTAADVLAKLLTVDGPGSGLDADTLDGINASAFALLAGATFVGNISAPQVAATGGALIADRVGDGASAQVVIRTDDGQHSELLFQVDGPSSRFILRRNNTAEAGSNAGSDLDLLAYNDAGALLGLVTRVTRATQVMAFSQSPTVPSLTIGDNSTKVANTAYVDAAIAAAFEANDAMVFRGAIDASSNPNYPAANAGHTYRISVAGKIGGASGPNVEVSDTIYCITDGSASGDHAAVGANWVIVQSNLDGAVIGPSAVTSGNPAVFSGTSGKLISEVTFAAFKASLAIAAADVAGLVAIATSGSASDLSSGTVPNARISGAYTGFTDITMSGDLSIGGGDIISTSSFLFIRPNTSDGADTGNVALLGGASGSTTRGAVISLSGNEHATTPGDLRLFAGDTGRIEFFGEAYFDDNVIFNTSIEFGVGPLIMAADMDIRRDTTDGSDNGFISIWGGGGVGNTRGAGIYFYGNEHGGQPGDLLLVPGATGEVIADGAVDINGTLNVDGTAAFQSSVVIGTGANLTMNGGSFTMSHTSAGTLLLVISTDAGATMGPALTLRRAGGSQAANDLLGQIRLQGQSSTDVTRDYAVVATVARVVTNGAEDGEMQLQTVQAGTLATRLIIQSGLYHNAATGGDKGAGSINMDAVYDDNVLLTCVPMQKSFIDGGDIDLVFWDAQVPDQEIKEQRNKHGEIIQPYFKRERTHVGARVMKHLIETGCDPRKPKSYFERMYSDEALPGMPTKLEWEQGKFSVGHMHTRNWLATELLAVTVMKMHERMEAAGI